MKKACYVLYRTFVGIAVVAVSLCAATSVFAVDQPRVLVDQYHFNTLSTSEFYSWSVSMLAAELASNGYAVDSLEVPASVTSLADCDVLVIPPPILAFSSDELAALQAFVSAGGGIWLAADYGWYVDHYTSWAQACQGVATALGYSLDNNRVTDPDHDLYDYLYWMSLDSSTLGNHEVVRGVSDLVCYSTTSLTGPAGASAIISTYPSSNPASSPLAMAKDYGSGRVLVTGSSLYMANPVPDRNINGQLVTMEGIIAADNRRLSYQAITYLAAASGRPLVSLSVAENQMVYGTVDIPGTVCDSALTLYVVEYAPVTDQSVYYPIYAGTESVIMGTLATCDTSTVPEGEYVLRVTAENATGNSYSQSVQVSVRHLASAQTIQEAKQHSDGTLVNLVDKVATTDSGDFGGCFYIQEPDRVGGIRVNSTGTVNAGDTLSVVGLLSTTNGERAIDCIELN